ncbi:MAG: ribose 5-phosphate isomerase A [Chlamydiae bacterium]|nr:ribose 5-phosphate isomerase A [Chlamydiota bacterium]
MSNEKEKQLVAKEAVKLVTEGMIVGIGSGSTAAIFIEELKKHVYNKNLKIACIATSLASKSLIEKAIPLIDESLQSQIDITFDGADRLDPKTLHLIKGGGGALLREKLVAKSSKENVVLVDSSKLSSPLEGFPLAIEIVKFGYAATIARIEHLGYKGVLRKKENRPAESDNGNYIFDITFNEGIKNPLKDHNILKNTLGVIETGFFLDTATKAYVAYPNGKIEILEKP